MMASFMRSYKKNKLTKFLNAMCHHTSLAVLSFLLSFGAVGSTFAADNNKSAVNYNLIDIFSAELVPVNDAYVLNAEAEIAFGVALEQAAMKGFDLHFIIAFDLYRPRDYWFNEDIASVEQRVILRYHPLSRQYLVIRDEGKKYSQQKAFSSLIEAEEELAFISDLPVFPKNSVESDVVYKAKLSMRLDRTKLPKAFQVNAINANDGKMSSQEFEWEPNF